MHSGPFLASLIFENSKIEESQHMQGINGVNLQSEGLGLREGFHEQNLEREKGALPCLLVLGLIDTLGARALRVSSI
jgi:hypothetical protein